MTRNLKALGLALMAVFATTAVVASAASAQTGVLTADGPVTLTAVDAEEEAPNALTAETGDVECPEALYTGHKYGVTPHEPLPSGAAAITLTPHYGLCAGFLGLRATIDMNGCDYSVILGEEIEGKEDSFAASTTTICPEGQQIEVTVYASKAKHEKDEAFCVQTLTTENSTERTGLTATDNTDGTIELAGTLSGLSIDSSGSFPCPNESGAEAEADVDIVVGGEDAEGEPTAVGLSVG